MHKTCSRRKALGLQQKIQSMKRSYQKEQFNTFISQVRQALSHGENPSPQLCQIVNNIQTYNVKYFAPELLKLVQFINSKFLSSYHHGLNYISDSLLENLIAKMFQKVDEVHFIDRPTLYLHVLTLLQFCIDAYPTHQPFSTQVTRQPFIHIVSQNISQIAIAIRLFPRHYHIIKIFTSILQKLSQETQYHPIDHNQSFPKEQQMKKEQESKSNQTQLNRSQNQSTYNQLERQLLLQNILCQQKQPLNILQTLHNIEMMNYSLTILEYFQKRQQFSRNNENGPLLNKSIFKILTVICQRTGVKTFLQKQNQDLMDIQSSNETNTSNSQRSSHNIGSFEYKSLEYKSLTQNEYLSLSQNEYLSLSQNEYVSLSQKEYVSLSQRQMQPSILVESDGNMDAERQLVTDLLVHTLQILKNLQLSNIIENQINLLLFDFSIYLLDNIAKKSFKNSYLCIFEILYCQMKLELEYVQQVCHKYVDLEPQIRAIIEKDL